MLVRRWRAFWQRRNFSKKRSSGCFYVIPSIQCFTLFFIFVVFVSHIETNVTKCKDKVKNEAFYVIFLDVCQRNQ